MTLSFLLFFYPVDSLRLWNVGLNLMAALFIITFRAITNGGLMARIYTKINNIHYNGE